MGDTTGVFESWRKAMLAGDADAIGELYEEDAVLLIPSMEILARGKDEIRAAWAGMLAGAKVESIDVSEHDQTVADDISYSMVAGVMKATMDGEPVELPFRATEVQRRGPDGTWRYVLDHG